MKRWISALLSVFILYSLTGCEREPERFSTTFFDVFDTVAVITGYAEDQEDWDLQMESIHSDLLTCHQLFDIYNSYEGINNLRTVNENAGICPVAVDPLILDLLELAQNAYSATGGSTNPAAGAVLSLWHDARSIAQESPELAKPPTQENLEEAMEHCGMANLEIDRETGTVFLTDAAASLDVGSIGKGFGVEWAAQRAEANGLKSALLNVGGNLRAIGTKPQGYPWTVGVENPWKEDGEQLEPLFAIELFDGESLVTSGDYQRTFTADGTTYHHLIDLNTGFPASFHNSVTILCKDAGWADALSTGLFCICYQDGQSLTKDLKNIEVLWCEPNRTTEMTPGLAARIENN